VLPSPVHGGHGASGFYCGRARRAGEGGRVRARRGRGWVACAGGLKGRRWPSNAKTAFSFIFSNPNLTKQSQIQNLEWKMAFSKLDPKTKVV
jgi:hypothetical protein